MRTRTGIVLVLMAALAACGGKSKPPDTTSNTGSGEGSAVATAPEAKLYDRLGGKDGITKVVDMFVANVKADARINAMFMNVDPGFPGKLVDQICEASGGPCKYSGKNMKEAHVGMNITGEHFDALVEDLVKAMKDAGVGEKEQAEILSVLGPMKSDIVTR